MRILMTTDTVGGVWTFTEELAAGLLARGCAVCLASIGDPPAGARQIWCDQMRAQWQSHFRHVPINAPLEWMSNNDAAYTAAAPSLLRLAHDFDAELLHSNQFCFGALPLEIPKVITAHSDVLTWAQACRGGRLEPSAWLTQYTELVTQGLARTTTIIAPTHWMARAFASTWSLPHTPSVVHNGRTVPAAPGRARKRQAVTAGRLWDEAKNIALLADVHSPMPLLVAGESTYDGADTGRTLSNVTLLGNMECSELLSLFRESALYICTSRYEPFGLAALEAALCGCAVLAYDIPSLREVWGKAVLYFDGADSLTSLLHQLDSDPQWLARAQHASFTRARLYSAEQMVDGYYRLFQQALAASEDAVHAA